MSAIKNCEFETNRKNTQRAGPSTCKPAAMVSLSRDETKKQILKIEEYFRVELGGGDCPNLPACLEAHESEGSKVNWSDIDDNGPIESLKNWAAEMTGLIDLGLNVNHRESLYYVVREWKLVSNQLFVLAFDVYDQQFVLISLRQSDRLWVSFLTGS